MSNVLVRRPEGLGAAAGKALIAVALVGLALWGWWAGEEFLDELEYLADELEESLWLGLARVSLAVGVFVLAWRIYLALTYRPHTPCGDAELPYCTVVVPAYNEGEQVLATLRSVAASRYPSPRLHMVAVDDGSIDDTWSWMQQAAAEIGPALQIIKLPANGGKRHALYRGFLKASSEVVVTMDSDSEVRPDTLRHLVTPLVRDPLVGAVAGNVRVLNRQQGCIPPMLEVNFTFSFDFIRASQSRINTVMTSPGALSAYRWEVIRPHLEGWVQQRFCGRPANIGEDRALTNLVLKSGFHTHFARQAEVFTKVPASYRGLCRMLLRWARSNVRETLVMTGFIFRRFRDTPALGARINLLIHLFRMSVGEWLKLSTLGLVLTAPSSLFANLLLAGALAGILPAMVYILRHRDSTFLWAFPYGIFWMLGLSWISLWALLTPHRNSWLTRGLGRRVTSPGESAATPLG